MGVAATLADRWDTKPDGLPTVPDHRSRPGRPRPPMLDLDSADVQDAIRQEIAMWANGNGYTAEQSQDGSRIRITSGADTIVDVASDGTGRALASALMHALEIDDGTASAAHVAGADDTPPAPQPITWEPL